MLAPKGQRAFCRARALTSQGSIENPPPQGNGTETTQDHVLGPGPALPQGPIGREGPGLAVFTHRVLPLGA